MAILAENNDVKQSKTVQSGKTETLIFSSLWKKYHYILKSTHIGGQNTMFYAQIIIVYIIFCPHCDLLI